MQRKKLSITFISFASKKLSFISELAGTPRLFKIFTKAVAVFFVLLKRIAQSPYSKGFLSLPTVNPSALILRILFAINTASFSTLSSELSY